MRKAVKSRQSKADRHFAYFLHKGTIEPSREDLIEAILCDWDWSISRDEAEKLADKQIAARIAARIIERKEEKC